MATFFPLYNTKFKLCSLWLSKYYTLLQNQGSNELTEAFSHSYLFMPIHSAQAYTYTNIYISPHICMNNMDEYLYHRYSMHSFLRETRIYEDMYLTNDPLKFIWLLGDKPIFYMVSKEKFSSWNQCLFLSDRICMIRYVGMASLI